MFSISLFASALFCSVLAGECTGYPCGQRFRHWGVFIEDEVVGGAVYTMATTVLTLASILYNYSDGNRDDSRSNDAAPTAITASAAIGAANRGVRVGSDALNRV